MTRIDITEFVVPVACAAAGVIVLSIFLKYWFSKHVRFRRYAKKEYKRLQKEESPAMRFGMMRHMNPFVFEELVIYALKKKGWKAHHGRRYTGDGGIDGYAKYKGQKYYIQDKRYSSAINPEHVKQFGFICDRAGVKGLFVHTGRTGKMSKDNSLVADMEIISGQRLLDLMDESRSTF